jgi:hypothetical protein
MRASTELIKLRIGTGGGLFVTGDQTLGFIKCGAFLERMCNCKLLIKDCAPWNYLFTYLAIQSHDLEFHAMANPDLEVRSSGSVIGWHCVFFR